MHPIIYLVLPSIESYHLLSPINYRVLSLFCQLSSFYPLSCLLHICVHNLNYFHPISSSIHRVQSISELFHPLRPFHQFSPFTTKVRIIYHPTRAKGLNRELATSFKAARLISFVLWLSCFPLSWMLAVTLCSPGCFSGISGGGGVLL